jgi:TnpA family transposase
MPVRFLSDAELARLSSWPDEIADIFGNPTDLPIAEHTTDTAGQTLATFAIFNLAGLQFSPRIRDVGRLQLYRLGPGSSWRTRYPHAGALLTQSIQTQLIADHWNDLLRLVGSMKFGHTTASLLIAKLHASSRQNSLARPCRNTAGSSAPSTSADTSLTKNSAAESADS